MSRIDFEKASERIGEVSHTSCGTPAVLIKYIDSHNVLIQFQDEYRYEYNTTYAYFSNGTIENPYDKTVFGVGYIGVGEHKITEMVSESKRHITKQYNCWHNLLMRCYSEKSLKTHKSYIGCSVCDEWLNFQNFAQWYDENYYECNNEKIHLDKDILVKNNKVYCPQNCIFVPSNINAMFTKSNSARGELPIGVTKSKNKYMVYCKSNILGKKRFLGQYSTPEEAFDVYKEYKEKYIKQVADYYKDKIPQKLYDALYSYEVLITD